MADEIQHERELREQWQDAHERFHTVDKEALALARREVDRRLDEMNKFREQIATERGEFLRRDMYDEQHSAMRSDTDARLKAVEKQQIQIAAVVGVALVGLQLFLHYLGK